MNIQIEVTPNPSSLKFLPGKIVMEKETADFRNAEEAKRSPFALNLFKIDGVEGVFFGSDFISITKNDNHEWQMLKPLISETIIEFYKSGATIMLQEEKDKTGTSNTEDTEAVTKIKDIIETKVRPAVAKDGGDITFQSFDNGIVYLQMKGSCSGCPSSTATLKAGIENMLKHYIPEVREVRPVT
jgi:Fe-S cluster biogenesis protein NfuA